MENMKKMSEREIKMVNTYSGIKKDLKKISNKNYKVVNPKEKAKAIGKKAKKFIVT